MKIIINNSSQQPIYEQIVEQIKSLIIARELREHTMLPSVRGLSKELRISALTVKKAYDRLDCPWKGKFCGEHESRAVDGGTPKRSRGRSGGGSAQSQDLRDEG